MATTLSTMFPDQYHPRAKDLSRPSSAAQPNRYDRPAHRTSQLTHQPPALPTPFVPLPNLPQPYSGMSAVPNRTPAIYQPQIPLNTAQVPFPQSNIPGLGAQPPYTLPTTHQYAPQLTYAQVANPSSQWNAVPTLNCYGTYIGPQAPHTSSSAVQVSTILELELVSTKCKNS